MLGLQKRIIVMSNAHPPATATPNNMGGLVGLWLVRVVVPLWITIGATTKLVSRSPKLLPDHLRNALMDAGLDLHLALSAFITIEFAAVAIMVCIPRLARPIAMGMLSVFCLVLLWEMFNGNMTNCGCLGSVTPPPWVMLAIDLLLLILIAALPVRPIRTQTSRAAWALASLLALGLGVLAFTRVLSAATGTAITIPATTPSAPTSTPSSQDASAKDNAPTASTTFELPAYYAMETDQWVGQPIQDIELFQWVPDLLSRVRTGQQYIVLYSRTCEHCQELLLEHFSMALPAPTTLIAIPERTDGFNTEGELENPCLDCVEMELPIGVDWLITPPAVIALEDGKIICAQEAEDTFEPQCLPWHGY